MLCTTSLDRGQEFNIPKQGLSIQAGQQGVMGLGV